MTPFEFTSNHRYFNRKKPNNIGFTNVILDSKNSFLTSNDKSEITLPLEIIEFFDGQLGDWTWHQFYNDEELPGTNYLERRYYIVFHIEYKNVALLFKLKFG